MSTSERRLLRKQINRKLYYMSNKESRENNFLNSSQMLTERQQMYMEIEKHFREKDNKRTPKKRIPFPIESRSLPHVNLARINRLLNSTIAITDNSDEIDKVINAHSYRTATPYYTNPELTSERGNFMNYSQHIGIILHTPRYIEFLKSLRESKSSNNISENKKNSDSIYSKSGSTTNRSSSNLKYTRCKSSNSSTSSNTIFERKNKTNSNGSDSAIFYKELSSTSLDLTINEEKLSTLSIDKNLSTEKSRSVLSDSENSFKDSSVKEKQHNSSRASIEKEHHIPSALSNKSKHENISQTSMRLEKESSHAELNFEDKSLPINDIIDERLKSMECEDRKSNFSDKSNEKNNSRNKIKVPINPTKFERSDIEKNQSSRNENIESIEIHKVNNEDLKQNSCDIFTVRNNKNNEIGSEMSENNKEIPPKARGTILTSNNYENTVDSRQEIYPISNSTNEFSIKTSDIHSSSGEKEKGSTQEAYSNNGLFNLKANNEVTTDFITEMEAFLYNHDINFEEVQQMKNYLETVMRSQVTNPKYVKDYHEFSSKLYHDNFKIFTKICNKHPIHTFSNDEVNKIKNIFDNFTNKNSILKENKDHENNKNINLTASLSNEKNIEKPQFELKSSESHENLKDITKGDLDDNEEIKNEKNLHEKNLDNEDFSDAFARLFRNSITQISKDDLQAIKKFAENYEISKNDINENKSRVGMVNDEDITKSLSFNEAKQSTENSVPNEDKKVSKNNFDDETLGNEPIIKSKRNKNNEMELNPEIESNISNSNDIDLSEENEILRSFRNLFRSSIDNIKEEDLEKVNQLIESHEKQFVNT